MPPPPRFVGAVPRRSAPVLAVVVAPAVVLAAGAVVAPAAGALVAAAVVGTVVAAAGALVTAAVVGAVVAAPVVAALVGAGVLVALVPPQAASSIGRIKVSSAKALTRLQEILPRFSTVAIVPSLIFPSVSHPPLSIPKDSSRPVGDDLPPRQAPPLIGPKVTLLDPVSRLPAGIQPAFCVSPVGAQAEFYATGHRLTPICPARTSAPSSTRISRAASSAVRPS